MSKVAAKPSVDQIKSLEERCRALYAPVYEGYELDDEFYELQFLKRLQLPLEFEREGFLLPTARDQVDAAVDHTDLFNARVSVLAKGHSKAEREAGEMLRKFGQGVMYMTNMMADISPWRVGGKFFWLYGLGAFQVLYDGDAWPDKPIEEEGEGEEEYAKRLDEWRASTHEALPIVIRAINPHNIMPDPTYGGRRFVIERHKKMVYDLKGQWPKWTNPNGVKHGDVVDYMSYWDADYRYVEADGEALLPGETGVIAHKYGFLPYVFIETGLGNFAKDGDLSKRYVGILRYMRDILVAESRGFAITDAVLKRSSWPPLALERGLGAPSQAEAPLRTVELGYGKVTELPPGAKLVPIQPLVPPDALRVHTAMLSERIASHGAARSLFGMGETGVRSGVDRERVLSEAGAKFRYSAEAFRFGTAKILGHCARVLKNVIPGDVRVWSRTPGDEFDMEVKKDKLREPFTFFVEFAPISEMDEYRRHDDLERLLQSGIITRRFARAQMSNVDPDGMEREEERERLTNDPALNAIFSQYAQGKAAAAISKRAAAEALTSLPPQPPGPPQIGTPGAGGATPPPEGPGRATLPPQPSRAPLGSAEELQLALEKQRSQIPMSATQGQGGGGNR